MGVSPHVGAENGTQICALNSRAISPACFAFKSRTCPLENLELTEIQSCREEKSVPSQAQRLYSLAHSFPESSSGVPLSNRSKMKLSV